MASISREIQADGLRMNSVIRAHDKAMLALHAAMQDDLSPEIVRECILIALGDLGEAEGQLNWWRAEAKAASIEFSASRGMAYQELDSAAHRQDVIERATDAARVSRIMAEAEQKRRGGQTDDTTPASDATPDVRPEHIWFVTPDGKRLVPTRLKSEGFGEVDDFSPFPHVESLLPSDKVGAEVLYAAAAGDTHGGFVGSVSGGRMQEICYILDGTRWYLYCVTFVECDSWQQQWWVSPQRLTPRAAADAIEQARAIRRAKS